eukprot:1136404-Pelagomonas_calceolata.AAC.6
MCRALPRLRLRRTTCMRAIRQTSSSRGAARWPSGELLPCKLCCWRRRWAQWAAPQNVCKKQ